MTNNYVKALEQSVAHIDRENAFLLYATFTGDVERTAHALGVRAKDVLLIATEENWNEKLKGIIDLKKSGRPGDIERAINRALNFVQAHRMRMIIERVVKKLTGLNEQELEDYLFAQSTIGKDGKEYTYKKLTTRALADLASAIEKCHAMSYAALNDTAQERVRRKDDVDEVAAGDMHVQIAKAMQEAGKSNSPNAQLFDAQLTIASSVVESKPPAKPDPYNQD